MVQKLDIAVYMSQNPFESSVVLDGTKTQQKLDCLRHEFESSVVLDGTKTIRART